MNDVAAKSRYFCSEIAAAKKPDLIAKRATAEGKDKSFSFLFTSEDVLYIQSFLPFLRVANV